MTDWISWIVVAGLWGLILMQVIYVQFYRWWLLGAQPGESTAVAASPRAAVVLCLRGADPSLPNCLEHLRLQDYPNYELHWVVDDQDDPAAAAVRKLVRQWPQGSIDCVEHVVTDHAAQRSLKCSSLISCILELPPEVEVVALVDADVVAPPDWLRQLVDGLADPDVGATTGNRWFAPVQGNLGSQLRKLWNAAALPQMCLYQIPWGGSLALRREVIQDCELLDAWSTSFCEDTLLTNRLRRAGLRVRRLPSLILVNDEGVGLRDALRWIVRQLLTVRLYHRQWNLVLLHALAGLTCLWIPPVLALYCLTLGRMGPALWLGISWIVYQLVNLMLAQQIEDGNRQVLESRPSGAPLRDVRVTSLRGLVANLVLQVCYPFLAMAAAGKQWVSWRGIDYRIRRRGRLEMVEYLPYAALQRSANGKSID